MNETGEVRGRSQGTVLKVKGRFSDSIDLAESENRPLTFP